MKLLIAMLVAFAFGGPAVAQGTCGTHANMMAQLDMKYGETRRGAGLSGPQSIFEMWASSEGERTWTILQVYPSGMACVRASGNDWETDPPVVPGDPA